MTRISVSGLLSVLAGDAAYGARVLARKPWLTAVTVLVLALGIGANSAIFSLVNAVLIQPLPYEDPHELVFVWESVKRAGVEKRAASSPDFLDWKKQNRSFDQLSGFFNLTLTLSQEDSVERVPAEMVSAAYFDMLKAKVVRGRTFTDAEDTPGLANVVVLSHSLWQGRFGGDPGLVGRTVRLNGELFTVVGVLEAPFAGVTGKAQAWVPMMAYPACVPELLRYDLRQRRDVRWHGVIGRLRNGTSLEAAHAEMESIARGLAASFPETNKGYGALLVPMAEQIFGEIKPVLVLLLGAVVCVLLIACSNLASLLLASASSRRREMAIRLSVGAPRGRLVRQLLTESTLLALLGGLLGLLMTAWTVHLLVALLATEIPNYLRIEVDARVLAFTLGLSVLTGLAIGLLPALRFSRTDLSLLLKEESASTSGGRRGNRSRNILMVAEVALTLLLLVGAGLLIKSFQQMQAFDPGFAVKDRIAMRINLPAGEDSASRSVQFGEQLLANVRALPGVQSAGLTSDIPLDDRDISGGIVIEGHTPPDGEEGVRVYRHVVSPDFFKTMGVSLLQGREFTWEDRVGMPGVVIVSERLASRYWPGRSPLGKRLKVGRLRSPEPWLSVVGVAPEIHYRSLLDDPDGDPDLYLPMAQNATTAMALMVSSQGETKALSESLRQEVRRMNPEVPVYDIATLEQRVAKSTANARFGSVLMGILAAGALALASLGLYGLISYSVTQRARELGIRAALGANGKQIRGLVIREGLQLMAIGMSIGLALSLLLTRVMSGVLYNVSFLDPVVFIASPCVLLLTAVVASYFPARRASRIDPLKVLRTD